MNKDRKVLLVSLIIFPLAVLSYVNFLVYQPKVVREVAVKGAETVNPLNLPFPDNSVKISSDQSSSSQQYILDVPKNPQEVQSFYKNVLLSDDWKSVSESTSVSSYKKNNQTITVTTTPKDTNLGTITSIEYSN